MFDIRTQARIAVQEPPPPFDPSPIARALLFDPGFGIIPSPGPPAASAQILLPSTGKKKAAHRWLINSCRRFSVSYQPHLAVIASPRVSDCGLSILLSVGYPEGLEHARREVGNRKQLGDGATMMTRDTCHFLSSLIPSAIRSDSSLLISQTHTQSIGKRWKLFRFPFLMPDLRKALSLSFRIPQVFRPSSSSPISPIMPLLRPLTSPAIPESSNPPHYIRMAFPRVNSLPPDRFPWRHIQ